MKKIVKGIEKVIAYAATKAATVEANTACNCYSYQPKEPKELKSLRKF